MKLTTKDIARRFAAKLELPVVNVQPFVVDFIEVLLEMVLEELDVEDKVELRKLGTFQLKYNYSRSGTFEHSVTRRRLSKERKGYRLSFSPSRQLKAKLRVLIRTDKDFTHGPHSRYGKGSTDDK